MLRLVGFFLVVLVTHRLLVVLPVIGPLLSRIGIFGFWAVALLVSFGIARAGEKLLAQRRLARRINDLGVVDTPLNRGKLGVLLLKSGRVRASIEHLEFAFDAHLGDNERALEWAHALGRAKLAVGEYQRAGELFARVVTEDPIYGYGEPYLGMSEAALALGRPKDCLTSIAEHDKRHGPNPRSAFVRGRALKSLDLRREAAAAFGEVFALRSELPAYQQRGYGMLLLRALVARLA